MNTKNYIPIAALGFTALLQAETPTPPPAIEAKASVVNPQKSMDKNTPVEKPMVETEPKVAVEKEPTDDERVEKRKMEVEALEEKINKQEAKLASMRERKNEKNETVEASKENSEGNANHARDLINAEADLVISKLEKAINQIDESRDEHTKMAFKTMEKGGTYTYDDKMKSVDGFLVSAKQILKKTDNAASLEKAEDSVKAVKENGDQ